jgi:hypothetical protein
VGKMKDTIIETPTPAPATSAPVPARAASSAVSTNEPNPWLAYGEVASAHAIVGDLLKFSKGDFVAGQDAREIPLGTELVANMDSLEIGYIKWSDNRPVDRRMGLVVDGFKPVRRSELDDNNRELWDVDDDGKPRDPWQFSNNLIMADATTGDLYTFSTSSKGGLNAIGELCKAYGQMMRQRPDEWPVVTLGVGSYAHSNKSYGRIKFPIFEIVAWAPKDGSEPAPVTPAPAPPPAKAAPQKAASRF